MLTTADPSRIESLRTIPFLAGLSTDHLRLVAGHSRLVGYEGDAVVFRRGRPARRFAIVRSGCVALSFDDGAVGFPLVGPGETFGECCIVERAGYPVTARTVGPCRLIEIDAQPLRQMIESHPEIGLALLSEVSRRLLTLVRQITDLKVKTAVQRLGSYLADLAGVTDGPAEIPLPFEKKVLAGHLGMQPETLSRALCKLQAAGVAYDAERHAFVVRDVRRLGRFAGADGAPGEELRAAPAPAATRHPPGSRTSCPTAADRALVRRTPLLAALSAADSEPLFAGALVHVYAGGGPLFQAGDRCDRLFAVAAGGVRLFALTADGCDSTIEVLGPETMFAEAALFGLGRYPINADALPGARVIALDADVFRRTLAAAPALAVKMLASLGTWHVRLLTELGQLRDRSPAQRLAGYFLALEPKAAAAGPGRTVRLPMAKAMIASRIGIAPESLSRALARLADLGVRSAGDAVHIDDADRLRRFAEGGSGALTGIKDSPLPEGHRHATAGEEPMLPLPPSPPTHRDEDPHSARGEHQACGDRPSARAPDAEVGGQPAWVAGLAAGAAARLDVRPILAAGGEPLPQILAVTGTIPPDGGLILEAPFHPLPLRGLLARQGFATWCTEIASGHWRLFARRRAPTDTDGAADSAPAAGSVPPAPAIDLDLRGLPPPKPLITVLGLIDQCRKPDGFTVRLDREPVLLFPELAERGWTWQRLADPAGGEAGAPDDFCYRLTPASSGQDRD